MISLLYVDDEPGLLELGKLFLESAGEFEVSTALSAESGLEQLGQHDYDAIVSDFQMPVMDGIALLKEVRKSFGIVPFILFTGRGREEVVIEAINNGVDFYLQKGGDPKAQFAELAHKVRQAVTRRRAETALSDSEKRLADIINFLPDATFAIDTGGKVIAWNRAIEEMTGIAAADMLGKGDYEYAVPFYGTHRRILIDLVFEPEKETQEHYTGITREKDVLIAETDRPRPRGLRRTLMGKASPLYNRNGRVVGAIESIRDITLKKETEAALQEQNRVLACMNQLSLELAAIQPHENIQVFAIKKLVDMTGALAAWFCDYDPADRILTISHLEVTPRLLKEAAKLLGKLPEEVRTPVSEEIYGKIINSRVLKFSTLTEVSFGQVSPAVSRSIQALAGVDRFYGLAYVIEGNLYGTSVLALKKGQSDPSKELLESFAHIMAVSLSRRSSEERLAASEEKFRTVADYTYGWEYWEGPDRSMVYMSPSCERISGYSTGDFYRIPRLLDSIVDPRDRDVWEDHRKEAETTTTALSIDFRIVRKDGGIRLINHICQPVFDAGGRHQGRRASNRDITEKRQKDDELRAAYEQLTASQEELKGQYDELASGEQRIRESEEKFRTFMEASTDGVMLIDVTGSILTWNLAQEQIFGIPALEAIGSNIIDIQVRLVVPEHKTPAYIEGLRSQFTTSFPDLFARKAPVTLEMEVMNVRGRRITIQQTLFPIQTSSGKRIGCISREVTEQRNAEKTLRESEAKYRELAELLPQMVFEMDPAFRITFANQKALTTMDLTEKDLEAGVSALSFLDPSDHERVRQNIEKIFRGEPVENHEYTAVRRDGSTFPVMIYAAPFSRFGKPAGFRGILIDITDQKHAEEELKESEERFRTLADAALGGIMIHDGGVIRDCNPQFANMFGYTPEEIIGRNGFEFMMTAESHDAISRWMQNGATGTIDITGIKKDGTRFYGETTSTPILLQGKQHTIVQIHDITARKESEQTLNLTIESANLGIWDVNMVTHRQVHNRLWIEMLGYSTEEIDKPFDWWQEHIHPDDVPGVIASFENHLTGRAPYFDALYRMKHRDGSWRWIDTRGRVISWDSQGQPIRMIGVNQEITRRKQAEDELRAAYEQITASEEELRGQYDMLAKNERDLRESEERFKTLFEKSAEAQLLLDGTGMVADCNAAFLTLFAIQDTREILGHSPDDFAPEFQPDGVRSSERGDEIIALLMREGMVRYEWAHLKHNTARTPILTEVICTLIQIAGQPMIHVSIRDITDRKNAENELKAAYEQVTATEEELREQYDNLAAAQAEISSHQQQLEEIASTIPGVVYQFYARPDGSRGMYFVSNRSREIFDLEPDLEQFFPGFTACIHPDDRTTFLKSIDDVVENRTDWHFEGRFTRHSGETIWFEGRSSPVLRGDELVFTGVILDITERMRTEEALFNSQQMLQLVLDSIPQRVFWKDRNSVYLGCNMPLARDAGYKNPEELVGKDDYDTASKTTADLYRADDRRVMETGEPRINFEEPQIRPEGSQAWLRTTKVPLLDKNGDIIGVLGTYEDITDQKRTEEALRDSEEKYRTLVETTSDFIWEVDASGTYTYVSPQVHRILGYVPEELLGKTPFDLMPPDEAEKIAAAFRQCVDARIPIVALENRAIRKDGSVVILETSGVVRTAKDGSYQGYRGIDRDITARKLTEVALHQKTEELNQYFTASLDLFCIADTEGFFRRLNPEWEKTLGYTVAELEGKRFLDFVHPDDLPATLTAVSDLDSQKEVINFTNRYRHKDGTYRWIEWRSFPKGNLIFAAARDITARHEAAERAGRISTLKQDLLRTAPLEEKLKRITDGIVDIFGADFARIWITMPGDLCDNGCIHAAVTKGAHVCRSRASCLHLIVSSGRYTHTDGGHRRVPLGAYKIGRIATGDETMFITNDVTHDPRVHDHTWAKTLGLESFAGFRLVSPEGNPVGVLAFFSRQPILPEVMEDLTDLATTASHLIQTGMAERAHRESEARLSSILHGSPVLQFVIDRNHRVISWNNALEEYSGIKAADMISTDQQWRAFYPKKRPVLADLLVDGNADAIDEWYIGKIKKSRYIEGAYEATDFFPHMGSSGIWLSFTAAPIRDDRGTIIGAVETLEDVTDQINAENALRESEERTRTILNTVQAGIVLVDAATHQIIDANNKALELIGLTRESVIGSVCHRFICPAEEGKCPVTDCGQKVDTSERVLLAGDGTRIPVLKTVVPIMMADRNVLIESFVDISEHMRSEAAVREANRKLNLLSSITRHDVANQLTAVQGYTQLAALKKPGPAVAGFLNKIASAVETMQHQIEFTKEYQELGVRAPGWFGIGDVIRNARPKKVRLRCTCDTVEVYADPMIGRVFFNLFDNAIRYGEKVTTITAGCKKRGDELVITFADNGVGIPPGEKQKIFEKGYGKNTGFGLFLAREILAITGITIHETGKPGKGARFEILVPKGAYRDKE